MPNAPNIHSTGISCITIISSNSYHAHLYMHVNKIVNNTHAYVAATVYSAVDKSQLVILQLILYIVMTSYSLYNSTDYDQPV